MDFFGIDILVVLLTTAFVVFWGSIFVAFVVFYDKNPYIPRKYKTVIIENKEGVKLRTLKGWKVTLDKVPHFRVGLKELPRIVGIHLDISVMETEDENGVITLIESVPDKEDAANFIPKRVPITQKEKFIADIINKVTPDGRSAFEVAVREAINKHSRLFDLNTSNSTKEYIHQARREAERTKGDDFITRYGPTLILIGACLFAYLILDGSTKAYKEVMAQQNAVMSNGYAQIVSQCGGTFVPLNPSGNSTQEQPKPGQVQLPFT